MCVWGGVLAKPAPWSQVHTLPYFVSKMSDGRKENAWLCAPPLSPPVHPAAAATTQPSSSKRDTQCQCHHPRAGAHHTQCRYGKCTEDSSSQKTRSLTQQKRARAHQRPEKRPSLNTRTLSHLQGRGRGSAVGSAGYLPSPVATQLVFRCSSWHWRLTEHRCKYRMYTRAHITLFPTSPGPTPDAENPPS